MQTGVDEVIGWSKMIFPITTIDEREILQMGIIIEGEIIEHDDTEKLQNFYRCSFDVFAYDVSTFLVT